MKKITKKRLRQMIREELEKEKMVGEGILDTLGDLGKRAAHGVLDIGRDDPSYLLGQIEDKISAILEDPKTMKKKCDIDADPALRKAFREFWKELDAIESSYDRAGSPYKMKKSTMKKMNDLANEFLPKLAAGCEKLGGRRKQYRRDPTDRYNV